MANGVIFYLVACLVVGFVGRNRRIAFTGFFLCSVLFTPLITLPFLSRPQRHSATPNYVSPPPTCRLDSRVRGRRPGLQPQVLVRGRSPAPRRACPVWGGSGGDSSLTAPASAPISSGAAVSIVAPVGRPRRRDRAGQPRMRAAFDSPIQKASAMPARRRATEAPPVARRDELVAPQFEPLVQRCDGHVEQRERARAQVGERSVEQPGVRRPAAPEHAIHQRQQRSDRSFELLARLLE